MNKYKNNIKSFRDNERINSRLKSNQSRYGISNGKYKTNRNAGGGGSSLDRPRLMRNDSNGSSLGGKHDRYANNFVITKGEKKRILDNSLSLP